MQYLTVVPAYGRDYTSKAKVMEAWNSGKDFQINQYEHRYDGKYINNAQHPADTIICIRFNNGTTVIQVQPPVK